MQLKTGKFFFLFFFPLTPTLYNPHIFPPLLSLPTLLHWIQFFCAVGQSVVRRREQSAAVWSSSCCLPDQRGNKRGLPGWKFLWRCLTDSQQLGPHSPPCRGQAAGLQGPRVTCPHWTGGIGENVLDGRVNKGRDVYVCCSCCLLLRLLLCSLFFFLPCASEFSLIHLILGNSIAFHIAVFLLFGCWQEIRARKERQTESEHAAVLLIYSN